MLDESKLITPKFVRIKASKRSISLRRLVCGIGINDSDYLVQPTINGKYIICPIYIIWMNMLRRCHSKSYQEKYPTYIGCTVCKEWLTFSNFLKWMEKQDWKGKCLDKDLLVFGNKIYSHSVCLFISNEINLLFTDSKASRGLYPLGVSKQGNKFKAYCRVNNKLIHLGYFNTPEEAHEVYKEFKLNHCHEVAETQIPKIEKLVIQRAELLYA